MLIQEIKSIFSINNNEDEQHQHDEDDDQLLQVPKPALSEHSTSNMNNNPGVVVMQQRSKNSPQPCSLQVPPNDYLLTAPSTSTSPINVLNYEDKRLHIDVEEEEEEEEDEDSEEDEEDVDASHHGDSEAHEVLVPINNSVSISITSEIQSAEVEMEPRELRQVDDMTDEDIRVGSPEPEDGSNNLDSPDYPHHHHQHQNLMLPANSQTGCDDHLSRTESTYRWPRMEDHLAPPPGRIGVQSPEPPPPSSSGK